MRAALLGSILDADPEDWDRLAGSDPFVGWGWLAALEESGAISPATGWTPAHVTLHDDEGLLAACPLYVRDDSFGEFVWDGVVQEAARRLGRSYAPRAVVTSPWTPVPGRKLLTRPGADRARACELLGATLLEVAWDRGWSTVNVHFCAQDEAEALAQAGLFRRDGWQYHWHNRGYADFEAFLAGLRGRRRRRMRRELRALSEQGVEVRFRPGDAADLATMGELYAGTWARHAPGSPVLTEAFFERLAVRVPGPIRLGVASRGGEVVAMTLNVLHGDTLYGRFWGCREQLPFLHFNLAYHAPVAHCIEAGLARFEPGHGGEYKRSRGFDPVVVPSMHWHRDRSMYAALARWAAAEQRWARERIAEKRGSSALRDADC